MKTKESIIQQTYLSINDIRKLFDMPFPRAKELFSVCKAKETEEVGLYRPYENKVKLQTILRATGIRLSILQAQIKNG